MPMHAYDADRDLRLYQKAEAAAKAGNQRMAEAIARLERLNVQLHAIEMQKATLQNQYNDLERSIIEEADAL